MQGKRDKNYEKELGNWIQQVSTGKEKGEKRRRGGVKRGRRGRREKGSVSVA